MKTRLYGPNASEISVAKTPEERIPMPVLLLLLALLLTACSADRQPGELFGPVPASLLVVDAILFVDQPLPDLFLRQTRSPDQDYSPAQAAVPDAQVTLQQGPQVFVYTSDPDSAGRYLPPPNPPLVQPETEYLLQVQAGARQLQARTLTPPRLRFQEAVLLDDQTLAVRRQLRTFNDLGQGAYQAPENQIPYLDGLLFPPSWAN